MFTWSSQRTLYCRAVLQFTVLRSYCRAQHSFGAGSTLNECFDYRIHSNRHAHTLTDTHSLRHQVLGTKMGEIDIKCMDLRSESEPIIMHQLHVLFTLSTLLLELIRYNQFHQCVRQRQLLHILSSETVPIPEE